jgi:hypothetical protein
MTSQRLTRLEDAVWQLIIVACEGQDPRTAPPDQNLNQRVMLERLGAFLSEIGAERKNAL